MSGNFAYRKLAGKDIAIAIVLGCVAGGAYQVLVRDKDIKKREQFYANLKNQ